MLYSQNGDRIMGTDSVTSLHPMYLGSEILAGDDFHSATDFWPGQNLVRSTTGLDSTDVKSGRVESSGWKSSPLVHVWVTFMPVAGPRVWNSLQAALRQITSYRKFRQHLKTHYLGLWGLEIAALRDSWFLCAIQILLLTYLLKVKLRGGGGVWCLRVARLFAARGTTGKQNRKMEARK